MTRSAFRALGSCLLAAGPFIAMQAGDAAGISAALDRTRADLARIIASRDKAIAALNARMAADSQVAVLVDLPLEATGILGSVWFTMELTHRGGRFVGGTGSLPSWNKGIHTLDGSRLTLADGKLTGILAVTLNPDPWVPADRKPRHQELRIAATVKDSQILGTYWSSGELGPDKDALRGTVKPVSPVRCPETRSFGDRGSGRAVLAGRPGGDGLPATARRGSGPAGLSGQLRAVPGAQPGEPAGLGSGYPRGRRGDPGRGRADGGDRRRL